MTTSQPAVVPAHPATFAALAVPNFRRYVSGQSLSLIGTWVETVAQALLVLRLTHSGTILGLTTAARYAPILLLSPYAGLLVDRYPKRRVLLGTQAGLGLVSAALGVAVLAGDIRLWQVVVLAVLFGVLSAVDNPARQAFVQEVVGHDLGNAVTLGIAELWSFRICEAEGHLERGIALARRIGRPLLEINGLAHWGLVASFPVVRTGGAARPASDRAGAAARLGRGAVCRDRLSDAGCLVDLAGKTGRGGTVADGGGICAPVRSRAGHRNAVPSGSSVSRDRPRPGRGGASRPACRRAPARRAAHRGAPAHDGGARVPQKP